MKYTKEQLEKIDFGRCELDGLTVTRHGTVLALFNGDECVAVRFLRGWVTDRNDIGDGIKIAYASDAVDAFVKSELERIEKLREPPEGYELCAASHPQVEFGLQTTRDGLAVWLLIEDNGRRPLHMFEAFCRRKKAPSADRSYTWPVDLDGEMFMVTLAKVKP